MARKGIHPLLRTVRIVMRNGASYQLPTTMNRTAPLLLQSDTTTHPAWTKEKAGISLEDERMQRLMSRFGGFVETGEELEEETPSTATETTPAEQTEEAPQQQQ